MIESFSIISGLIAFFSIFFKWDNKIKQLFFWCFIILLIIFDGLRWETGADWQNYYEGFNNALEKSPPGFEIGFIYYTWAIRNLTDNYSIYLLITSAIIYIGIFYTIFRITSFSFISLFFLTSHIPWYSGSMRQILALVFFVLSLKYVWNKNLFRFLLFMYSGLLFHSTMLPFFLIYWMFGASLFTFAFLGLFLILASSIIIIFITQIDFLINIGSGGHGIEDRIGGSLELSSPILGLGRKISTIALNFFFFKYSTQNELHKNRIELDKLKFFLYLSSFSLIFYIVGTFFITHVSSRLDIYTGIICLAIFIGLIEHQVKSRKHMLYLFIFVIFLCLISYSRLEFMDLFHPYKSIFYNTDYKRELY